MGDREQEANHSYAKDGGLPFNPIFLDRGECEAHGGPFLIPISSLAVIKAEQVKIEYNKRWNLSEVTALTRAIRTQKAMSKSCEEKKTQ